MINIPLLYIFLGNLAYGFSTGPPRAMKFRPSSVTIPISNARADAVARPSFQTRVTGGETSVTPRTALDRLSSAWAAGGLACILSKSVARILPTALEPFRQGATPLTPLQLALYGLTCLFFAYAEGYKGFQKKFAPMVVARAFALRATSRPLNALLGPFYAMGLFHATRKRKILSWSLAVGVAVVVAAVKRLPYPWRSVLDAGVVVGLSWGIMSILIGFARGWTNGFEVGGADPALPSELGR